MNKKLDCFGSVEPYNDVTSCPPLAGGGFADGRSKTSPDVALNPLAPCGRGQGEGLKNCPKAAFTLAEVLITLGIIGIVAAITMPTLINKFKARELEIQFKKVDSNLQQAIQRTVIEMGYSDVREFNHGGGTVSEIEKTEAVIPEFREIFLKQFPEAKEYNCYLYFYKNLPCKTLMGGNEGNFTACCSPYNKTYILPNGFLLGEPYAIGGEIAFYFDTNGPYKGPNRTGHDRFIYSSKAYSSDNGIYDLCNPNKKSSFNQSGCYRWASKNVNPLDNSKPYWDVLFKDRKYWIKDEQK